MNIDARKRFKEGPHGKMWGDFVASEAFNAAAEAALVSMAQSLPPAPELATAAANDWRMQGARLILGHLMNLTESEPAKPEQRKRYNYKV